MRAAAVPVVLLAVALAGCLGTPVAPLDPSADGRPVWERGLATQAATPDIAPRRSAEDRVADVAPPGAPQFAAFDAAMAQFMDTHGVPSATVAVLRDGQLRYEQGYGFLDEAGTTPTPPNAMFRIASITKPMTAAVITMLVEQDLLAWEDPVFCLPPEPAPDCRLPIAPHPARPVQDARLADLQVRHLVDHRTGWTRGPCTEPFWDGQPIAIAEQFGIPTPPPAWRLAQWFMGTPMEFDPGTDPDPTRDLDPYCNMGYVLLGLIAEAATGTRMAALYDAYIFGPLEVRGDLEPGHSLPERRNPREPFYFCEGGMVPSVYDPGQTVCAPDGGFDLDGILPAGGLVGTAAAVGAVYEVFTNDGRVRDPGPVAFSSHSGGLPGTATTAQRNRFGPTGDLQVVIFFNKQGGPLADEPGLSANYPYQTLHATLLAAYAEAEATAPLRSPAR